MTVTKDILKSMMCASVSANKLPRISVVNQIWPFLRSGQSVSIVHFRKKLASYWHFTYTHMVYALFMTDFTLTFIRCLQMFMAF